jgi:cell division protein FtsW (lipid II flippase)
METERDLASPDFGSTAAIGMAAVAMNRSAKGGPRWLKRFVLVCTVIVAAMALLKVVTSLSAMGKIPACDAKTTKDTLSDLNKQQKFNASHYNSLTARSSTDTEALCTASLALRDGTTVEYDYRIFKDGGAVKVQMTDIRRP